MRLNFAEGTATLCRYPGSGRYRVTDASGNFIPFVAWCDTATGEVACYVAYRLGDQVLLLADAHQRPAVKEARHEPPLTVVEMKSGPRVEVDGKGTWPEYEHTMTREEFDAIPELVPAPKTSAEKSSDQSVAFTDTVK